MEGMPDLRGSVAPGSRYGPDMVRVVRYDLDFADDKGFIRERKLDQVISTKKKQLFPNHTAALAAVAAKQGDAASEYVAALKKHFKAVALD